MLGVIQAVTNPADQLERAQREGWRYDLPEKVVERFEAKIVRSDGCWTWTGHHNRKGYGAFGIKLNEKWTSEPIHRIAYELWVGPIPKGRQIDHLCRNRGCCRPDHLEVVTAAENSRRGKQSKLSKESVREIKRLAGEGMRAYEIAPLFGVKRACISHILNGRNWRGVE